MKKLLLPVLFSILFLPVVAFSTSIGDPETMGAHKFAIGIDQEFVFDRDLESKSSSTPIFAGLDVDGEVKSLYRTMFKASYGLFSFMDIYVKLGAARFKAENDIGGIGILEFDTESRAGFAYGGGVKVAFPCGKSGFLVGVDMQYLRHKNKTETDILGLDFDGKTTVQTWHIAPYVGMKLGNFTPYAGVRYSDARVKSKVDVFATDLTFKFKADDNIGAFVGTTYKIGKNFSLNVEGRFIDETALSFGATYRFK